jgi:spermidine dehydrogenase
MSDNIQRRDFLNGVLLAAGAAAMSPLSVFAQDRGGDEPARPYFLERGITESDPRYYPPSLTGMRGSHPGSFEPAHRMRDEGGFEGGPVQDTGEAYDLVVVGGGISGLSSAFYYQKERPDARVLIVENHDDFGGHAKRNEFRPNGPNGPMLIGYGGTQSIELLSAWTDISFEMLRELGIDLKKFETNFYDHDFRRRHGLSHCVFFDKATFGRDVLLQEAVPDWKTFVAKSPLKPQAKKDLLRIQTGNIDYLPGLSIEEKTAKLSKMSFATFLLEVAKVHPQVVIYFQRTTNGSACTNIDVVDAMSVIRMGVKRPQQEFIGGPTPALAKGLGFDFAPMLDEPYIYHFPDGNATVARLLVRRLIPDVAPGSTPEDIVTARFNYATLDRPTNSVRLRLNSTAVRAKNVSGGVEVTYVRDGKPYRVRGAHCVMAGWNMVIPYLCPEMPDPQKTALRESVKTALCYTNVVVRNWHAIKGAGLMTSYCPGDGCYFTEVYMDFPISVGAYRYTASPDDPAVIRVVRPFAGPGETKMDQHRSGRAELLATPFSTFETEARKQLTAMFGPHGFNADRDILAITVNRWPHGYARSRSALFDPEWTPETQPNVIGRRPFGRIAIANSDAAWSPSTEAAIEQAHRAVHELLA